MKEDQITYSRDIFIQKFSNMVCSFLLDLVQPEVDPFDHQSSKPYSRTKHEVDWMTHCRDITIQNFKRWQPLIKCEIVPFDPMTPKTPP